MQDRKSINLKTLSTTKHFHKQGQAITIQITLKHYLILRKQGNMFETILSFKPVVLTSINISVCVYM